MEIPSASNVLPLMGVPVSESRFAMISNWMADGNINYFVKSHPDVDRLALVGSLFKSLLLSGFKTP